MRAQDAVQFGPESLDRFAALVIQEVRPELDRDAAKLFKGVPQEQKLGFSVQPRSLHTGRVPGRAYLNAAIRYVNVHEARHANDLVGRKVDHREWQHGPACL